VAQLNSRYKFKINYDNMVETISKGEFLFVTVSADNSILGWVGLSGTFVVEKSKIRFLQLVLYFYETGRYDVIFYLKKFSKLF